MVTPDQFRSAISRLPTGVTIVTANGPAGPAGATANAVTSVSLNPPLILACLDRDSRTLTALREAGRFAVNVLAADQANVARRFSTKEASHEKWLGLPMAARDGVPIIDGAVIWVDCRVRDVYDGGDHEIAVGEVLGIEATDREPLVVWSGAYRPLG